MNNEVDTFGLIETGRLSDHAIEEETSDLGSDY